TALDALIARIAMPGPGPALAAQARLDHLTKPPGSLGRLEELARQVAVIVGHDAPRVERPVIFTLAGDHGVVAEGGSAYPEAAPDCVGTGEMGIGNTTAASALTAALTGADPAAVTGRGTGLDEPAWRRKVEVIRRALAANRPDPRDPLGVLAALGGLEIAGL